MLTPPDQTTQGSLVNYALGMRRADLYWYLKGCTKLPWRMVPLLRRYFRTKLNGVEYLPYKDSTYFDAGERIDYFKGIPRKWLQEAVILMDPDVGLCPPSGSLGSAKYVLPHELLWMKGTMGPHSILLTIQFRRGKSWDELFEYTQQQIGAFDCIYKGDLAFLCQSNSPATRNRVSELLTKHATRNGLRTNAM